MGDRATLLPPPVAFQMASKVSASLPGTVRRRGVGMGAASWGTRRMLGGKLSFFVAEDFVGVVIAARRLFQMGFCVRAAGVSLGGDGRNCNTVVHLISQQYVADTLALNNLEDSVSSVRQGLITF
jgi:hypothetical protein